MQKHRHNFSSKLNIPESALQKWKDSGKMRAIQKFYGYGGIYTLSCYHYRTVARRSSWNKN